MPSRASASRCSPSRFVKHRGRIYDGCESAAGTRQGTRFFFYQLRFVFGGESYSLYAVENDIIRARYRDARIHFVLNCASESCPVLRPELPEGDQLEAFLQQAAVDFVNDDRNVRIDQENKVIVLSTIFKWFRKDFINDLRRRGLPSDRGLIDYIASVSPTTLGAELGSASDYEIVFADYDWKLNQQK